MNYILPHSFEEINDTLKTKIREDYNITDAQYQGSNMAILANIFSYLISMVNTNMNFGVNEMIISKATTKKNIMTLARELGYEPQRKRSFVYRIKLKAESTGVLRIPKFTKFKSGDVDFLYTGEDIENKFGSSCSIEVRNFERFNDLKSRKGELAGSIIVSNDNEVLEVLEKVSISGGERLLLNNISDSGKPLSLYSNIPTSLYKRDPNTKEMIRVADIETFTLDETNKDNPEFIIQLKNIDPTQMPFDNTEVVRTKFFTDDCEYHVVSPTFEGWIASDYNTSGEIIKFKLNDNYTVIDGTKKYINDLITLFRLKRFSTAPEEVSAMMYSEDRIIGRVKRIEQVDTCVIEVKEGTLLDYNTNPELVVNIDNDLQERGYVPLDFQNIEQDGVFLEISRVNYKNELVIKQPWTQRSSYIAPHFFNGEDTSFIVLTDYINDRAFLKIYTKYASSGTKFYTGNIFYFRLLQTKGAAGEAKELMSIESEEVSKNFKVIPYEENKEDKDLTIKHILVSAGSDEEDIESIRTNAPLYNNLADRLVTKHDYQTFCRKFQFIEQAIVWGGEELEEGPRLGHIFFSFIPASRPTEYITDENSTVFNLKNADSRDLFYLPEEQIFMKEDGGNENSVFEELSKNKIITLQYHYEPPIYLDFIVKVKVVKYLLGKSNKELRENLFAAAREYFKEVETFESEIFESNIIKYIDKTLYDNSGIQLAVYLETSIDRDSFIETGPALVETSKKFYSSKVLFQFPIDGIFEDNVLSHNGEIIEFGKLIKSRLPGVYNNSSGSETVTDWYLKKVETYVDNSQVGDNYTNEEETNILSHKLYPNKGPLQYIDYNLVPEEGEFSKSWGLYLDFNNIKYSKVVQGIITELKGTDRDIDSSVISFHVPIMLDTRGVEENDPINRELKQIGWLQVYNNQKMIYIQIDATDSENKDDLKERADISLFDTKIVFGIRNDANIKLKRNTFPRLRRLEVVEELE